jgi:hypothetical protein
MTPGVHKLSHNQSAKTMNQKISPLASPSAQLDQPADGFWPTGLPTPVVKRSECVWGHADVNRLAIDGGSTSL